MFARFSRHALRRAIHTSSSQARASSTAAFPRAAVTVSLATAAYFTWQLSTRPAVALDSVPATPVDRRSTPSLSSELEKMESPSFAAQSSSQTSPDVPQTPVPVSESTPLVKEEQDNSTRDDAETKPEDGEQPAAGGASGGAYDPVTGEINWDCPCLGGMAHGPCGQEFRDAFSCFVHSEDEPKGIDCVEKFKAMQNCFREHPEVYGDEVMDDDDEDESPAAIEVDPSPGTEADTPASAISPAPSSKPASSS